MEGCQGCQGLTQKSHPNSAGAGACVFHFAHACEYGWRGLWGEAWKRHEGTIGLRFERPSERGSHHSHLRFDHLRSKLEEHVSVLFCGAQTQIIKHSKLRKMGVALRLLFGFACACTLISWLLATMLRTDLGNRQPLE